MERIKERKVLVSLSSKMERSIFILGETYTILRPRYPSKIFEIRDKNGVRLMYCERNVIGNCFEEIKQERA